MCCSGVGGCQATLFVNKITVPTYICNCDEVTFEFLGEWVYFYSSVFFKYLRLGGSIARAVVSCQTVFSFARASTHGNPHLLANCHGTIDLSPMRSLS
jgi:hypothetical protein